MVQTENSRSFSGVTLEQLIGYKKLELSEFILMAIRIAEALQELHHSNIIHYQINPACILINPKNNTVRFTNPHSAESGSSEPQKASATRLTGKAFWYLSPEQTGRIHQQVDYRTDFYSLGVTLYQALLGRLPFKAQDELGFIHCHLAVRPVPPHEINPVIPPVISEILMKLMEKTADERYQSALGLAKDLTRCLEQLQQKGIIESFELGAEDISDKFQLPQKLFGREEQKNLLQAAFERISKGSKEVLMVTGAAGTGKSSLINELDKQFTQGKGYFFSGKFDQYQHETPYSGWIQVFKQLTRQLLTQSEAQLEIWRQKLLHGLGKNGQVIRDVIPEIGLILGELPPVIDLPPDESKNRFNMVFQRFIRIFCAPEHPLVLFLDDLQWADVSSLKLLEVLMSDSKTKNLLFLGAYRNNEIPDGHMLPVTIENIKNENLVVNSIKLEALSLSNVQQMLTEAFKSDNVAELAELAIIKTGGNPFFLKQFLTSFYRDKLIRFDYAHRKWEWDIQNICRADITDNVVELIAGRIRKLPPGLRELLKIAACIGNKFEVEFLSIVSQKLLAETDHELREAVREGILTRIDNLNLDLKTPQENIVYSFIHDRIQQAAYSLIEEDERLNTHLTIGRLMLNSYDPQGSEERLLDIVNQLNLGIELIDNEAERETVARLELLAGKKSKQSTAYEAAYQYFMTGISLVDGDSWNTQYELTHSLYVEAGEAAYLTGDFSNAEFYLETATSSSNNLLDKIKAYEVRVASYSAQNKLEEAIAIAQVILKLIGINIPKKPSKLNIIMAIVKAKIILSTKHPNDILSIPLMTDPIAIAVDRVMIRVGVTAYKWDPNFFLLLILRLFDRLYLVYGNSDIHSNSFTCLGIILCLTGDYKSGYIFGELAFEHLDRLATNEFKPFAYQNFYTYIAFWRLPLKNLAPPLLEAFLESMEVGNRSVACLSIFDYCFYSFFAGKKLSALQDEMSLYSEEIYKTKNKELLSPQLIFHQTVLNLMGLSDNPCILKGRMYDWEQMLPRHFAENDINPITCFYACSLILNYLLGNYEQAVEYGKMAMKYINGLVGTVGVQYIYFYETLALLGRYYDLSLFERYHVLRTVTAKQRKIRRWAREAQINFLHMDYLIKAEKARALKRDRRAITYYEKAIEQAVLNESIREEALANELAAKFYLSLGLGNNRLAGLYMTDAYSCYQLWGATAKVSQLENQYPSYLNEELTQNYGPVHYDRINISAGSPEVNFTEPFDLATMKKVSQAMSGEIVLENLLKRLIEIVLENACAQQVILILKHNEGLFIEAFGKMDVNREINLKHIEVEKVSDSLPESIVNYVVRTKESVVLDNASDTDQFINDPYIQRTRPKSILCMPIVNQCELKGVLYLENNLVKGAFTEDRITILNVLSSQLAISIENTLFYNRLDELVNQRTDELTKELEYLKKSEKRYGGRLVTDLAQEVNTPHLENLYSLKRTVTEFKSNLIHPLELEDKNRLLSKREAEVAELLCQRLTMTEIAAKLMLSPRTVQSYVENIKEKLGARSKREILEKLLKDDG